MKKMTTALGTMLFAAGLLGASACGGSGCGAPEDTSSDYQAPTAVQCPNGYVARGSQCVRVQNTSGEANTGSTRGTASTLSTSGN